MGLDDNQMKVIKHCQNQLLIKLTHLIHSPYELEFFHIKQI